MGIDIPNNQETMWVKVFDKDLFDSDAVGSLEIKVADLCKMGGSDEWYTILYSKKSAGTIRLNDVWSTDGRYASIAWSSIELVSDDVWRRNGYASATYGIQLINEHYAKSKSIHAVTILATAAIVKRYAAWSAAVW